MSLFSPLGPLERAQRSYSAWFARQSLRIQLLLSWALALTVIAAGIFLIIEISGMKAAGILP